MQIDFHHTVTYVTARLAGFKHGQADIIAHAAQYVDDATSSGPVYFENGAIFSRISSAHEMVDVRNLQKLANQQAWLPFHFLPGNDGLGPGQNPEGSFVRKIICKPDSPIARKMVRQAILDQDKPYGLHRLGVTLHVYADTWAHQNFAGLHHEINEVEDPVETGSSGVFDSVGDRIKLDMIDDIAPALGHGRAYVLPDMPFLAWKYKNGHGEEIRRHNTDEFCEAADQLCRAMQQYRERDPNFSAPGIGNKDMHRIQDLFGAIKKENAEKRHRDWLQSIREGVFSFGSEEVFYAGKSDGSWKGDALGTSEDQRQYPWKKHFLESNWKLFHDAIQVHRLYVVHDLLPQYGICAA
jgi:hypothetical protein